MIVKGSVHPKMKVNFLMPLKNLFVWRNTQSYFAECPSCSRLHNESKRGLKLSIEFF